MPNALSLSFASVDSNLTETRTADNIVSSGSGQKQNKYKLQGSLPGNWQLYCIYWAVSLHIFVNSQEAV